MEQLVARLPHKEKVFVGSSPTPATTPFGAHDSVVKRQRYLTLTQMTQVRLLPEPPWGALPPIKEAQSQAWILLVSTTPHAIRYGALWLTTLNKKQRKTSCSKTTISNGCFSRREVGSIPLVSAFDSRARLVSRVLKRLIHGHDRDTSSWCVWIHKP